MTRIQVKSRLKFVVLCSILATVMVIYHIIRLRKLGQQVHS
ncbi:hypothetical protein KSF78_0008963 [Schistosoma japonicum]|nr:hypothetical protein KSF78_0008963 [Schistosoma japonicum]